MNNSKSKQIKSINFISFTTKRIHNLRKTNIKTNKIFTIELYLLYFLDQNFLDFILFKKK